MVSFKKRRDMASHQSLPVLFLSHGAGPAWQLDSQVFPAFKGTDKHSPSAQFLRTLQSRLPLSTKPRALLVVSAHWEEEDYTVMTHPKPPLYFDYYNFPPETYKLEWPVSGAPELAGRVVEVLQEASIQCRTNNQRGLDHGVFIPLMLVFPEADLPVFQVSLKSNMSLAEHLALGEALAPLRDEGFLIVGSGMTTHNTRAARQRTLIPSWATQFRQWIHDALCNPSYTAKDRKAKLLASESEASFSDAHPRSEHYLPLVVASAAGKYTPATLLYDEFILCDLLVSSFLFE